MSADGRVSHEHPHAFNLEYAVLPEELETNGGHVDDSYKAALEIASELIRGTNSSIECLQMYCNEYAKKNKNKC